MILLFFAVLSVALVAGPFLSLAQPPPSSLAQCIPGTDPWVRSITVPRLFIHSSRYDLQSFNSIQQSPCEVAADLAGICTHGELRHDSFTRLLSRPMVHTNLGFNIPPLVSPNAFYLGPTAGASTDCVCSTVYYSLLSACALCQNFPEIRRCDHLGFH